MDNWRVLLMTSPYEHEKASEVTNYLSSGMYAMVGRSVSKPQGESNRVFVYAHNRIYQRKLEQTVSLVHRKRQNRLLRIG